MLHAEYFNYYIIIQLLQNDLVNYFTNNAMSGIQVHAWLNPYRANLAPNKNGLASNHMCVVYSQYCYVYGNYMWMDPAASVAVDRLISVIVDILTRYIYILV